MLSKPKKAVLNPPGREDWTDPFLEIENDTPKEIPPNSDRTIEQATNRDDPALTHATETKPKQAL